MNINLTFKICCIASILPICATDQLCQNPTIHIKVLINSKQKSTNETLIFSSKNGLLVTCSDDPTKKLFFKQRMPLVLKKKSLFINHKKNDSTIIRIMPVDGTTTFAGQRYTGSIYVFSNADDIAVVNRLPLEQYLESVLYTEGWPGWPLETYKVLAITCRTYVVWQLQHARKTNKQYHIKATNHHQTFTGLHFNEVISQAVKETEGIIITYHREPILAMYDACCGGIIPAKTTGIVDFSNAPYLARKYPCTFCQDCKIFSWERSIPLDKTIKRLHDALPKLTSIVDIQTTNDAAGITKSVSFFQKGRKRPFHVNRKTMYNLFPEVKSFAFACSKQKNSLHIEGVGFGHHIGLCQWGAQAMVEQDWDYKQIIHFYYPNTKLMKLCTRKKTDAMGEEKKETTQEAMHPTAPEPAPQTTNDHNAILPTTTNPTPEVSQPAPEKIISAQ